ncbi:DUF4404 family protein [Massilia sp. PAMC28688]|uniref:DUF4404 family protein n=1 Tax=Massilia sp. PAMC28688 TaxID=2861283 RepID=UPI001C62BA43|nr:DUF4404 family protein [Massilia sp. PAMC28688]QYF95370.1 DUF4404 family protein [Massilia sp. PAMC28688]
MLNDTTANLKSHLKELHANLSQTGTVDAELQELLRQLDGDIQQLLERPISRQPDDVLLADASGTTLAPQDLSERTQEIAARFAVEHPRLEPALRELSRMLANIGI